MQRTPIAFFAAAALLVACSSSDFQTAPSDTGTSDDTASGSDSSADATKACILPPAATGGEGDFCVALADYYSRCGHCESCVQTDTNNCIAFGDAVSKVFKDAFVACKDGLACGAAFGDWAKDPCILSHMASGDLSEKQKQAKDKFCATCPSNKYECDNFFGATDDAGADGGTAGLGAFVLYGNDDAVQKMMDNCSTAADCGALYAVCSAIQFCGPIPADACGSKFCNK